MRDDTVIHKVAERNKEIEEIIWHRFYSHKLKLFGVGQGDLRVAEASYEAFELLVSKVKAKRHQIHLAKSPLLLLSPRMRASIARHQG